MHAFHFAYGAHPSDGHDFFEVGLDATLRDYVSEYLPLRKTESAFFGIQFDAKPSEVSKGGI
jgi:hypothetical protein